MFLQVQLQEPSSADETGSHEDCHRKGRPSLLELTAPQIAAQINASQSSSNRHISASTVQRRLRESGLHGQIAANKPLLKDTNKNKRLAWAKKHEQWTLDQWKSDLLVWWVQIWDFWFQPRFLCETQSRWTDAFVPTVKHGAGGLMMWGCFAGDTVCDLFRIQGTLNQHGSNSILQQYTNPSDLCFVGLSFVFQQDNDPTHLQAV